uniref:Uncharacterized protein n=1 Tax=Physcomitrium patens TaxID=3218 RepID=A0A2K1J715_PHYPA|nr:hypothetical protein PHYPA_020425 [Physcomitrium patens]
MAVLISVSSTIVPSLVKCSPAGRYSVASFNFSDTLFSRDEILENRLKTWICFTQTQINRSYSAPRYMHDVNSFNPHHKPFQK